MVLPPFLTSSTMRGDPPCSWSDFLSPQLRRFRLRYTTIKTTSFLGHGVEGCVACVKFDDGEPEFALKIFFDSAAPGETHPQWWPLEREARAIAVLEKVQAGIRQSSPKPVHVPAKRTTRLDCLRCLYAFSTDGLLSRPFDQLPAEQKFAISGSPTRLRECYGWTRVRGADFLALNDSIEVQEDVDSSDGEVSASLLEADREYFALVYEYIPKAGLEFDAVQRQLDFFYHIGFQHCQVPDQRNWQGPGILLDFGDYHSPVDQWFHGGDAFTTCPLAAALLDWDGYMAKLSKKTTKEEVRAGKKFEARGKTARYVESGYDGELWSVSYFKLTAKEILEKELEEDHLASIHIPVIEPKAVRKAWGFYKRAKEEYFAKGKRASCAPLEGSTEP